MARPARLMDGLHRLRRMFLGRTGEPAGVLLVSAGGLGDTILFSVVASRFASLAKPGEAVTALFRHDGAKTAFCLPPGIQIDTVDFGRFDREPGYRWETLERLFQANYRLVISTDFLRHPYLDEAMIAAANAPDCYAMQARPWPKYDAALAANRRFYSDLFDSGPAVVDKVVRWNAFANWLLDADEPPPKVHLDAERLAGPAIPSDQDEIIVQPFSAVAAKQPDAEIFLALADALAGRMRLRITGLQSDLDKNPEFEKLVEKQNVEFDSSSFSEICAKVVTAKLVVSVDTAFMHLASALGAPTLCLASAAYVGEIVPYDDRIKPENVDFLFQEMPCQGCLGDCIHPLEDGRFPCVAALTRDRVLEAVLSRI